MVGRRWLWLGVLLLLVLAAVFLLPGIQVAGPAVERLANGGFEEGFYPAPPGNVGNGWRWFHNGGGADYGFYDETWAPVVARGDHGQMIEISTYGRGGSDPDRYAGIYQTVAVVPGEVYELSMQGMLRALADDPDRTGYNYRLEYGVDYGGGSDWTKVETWIEVPWDTVHPRLEPGTMDVYSATLTATGDRLTLYLRAWKKWATTGRELDVNLDAVSLKGAMPADKSSPSVALSAPKYPVVGWRYDVPVTASNDVGITRLEFYVNDVLADSVSFDVGLLSLSHTFRWTPQVAEGYTLQAIAYDAAGAKGMDHQKLGAYKEGQFVVNGDFEGGFVPAPLGVVGKGWRGFFTDSQASYGFYDETWPPVVYEGDHSMMIEINTRGRAGSDPNRYAGVYQTIGGLVPGATYKLSLHGMLRALSDDDDLLAYAYRVEWGYDPDGGTNWKAVDNWVEIPWNRVYPRLEPGDMSAYSTTIEAPAEEITLFFRVWKKWGTVNRELDANLDGITLKGAVPKAK
jgi:hypothetical protein